MATPGAAHGARTAIDRHRRKRVQRDRPRHRPPPSSFTHLAVFEKRRPRRRLARQHLPRRRLRAPSHLCSYSFEPEPDWSRRFAEQPEILDYLRHCATKYGLLPHFRFGTEVVHAEYRPEGRWRLHTQDGAWHDFDLLVAACGQLSNPAVPALPGLDAFTGKVFHSARWDHGHNLKGGRIAVVGNGASAIQFVPLIAPDAADLTVFQLEAHWISRKPDRVYPRWRRALNRRLPTVQKLSRLGIFLWFELLLNPALVTRAAAACCPGTSAPCAGSRSAPSGTPASALA